MNNKMDVDEEDERNTDDNEISEKRMKLETNLTEGKQATEIQDSTGDHKFDEKSIISMFIYNTIDNYNYTFIIIISNVLYMKNALAVLCQFWVQTLKLKFTD